MKYWNRLDVYHKIRKRLNRLEMGHDEYCGLCYQPLCDHKVEKIDYRNAQAEMTWWAETALMEYPGKYVQMGEVNIFPTWPLYRRFKPEFEIEKYTVFPKIKNAEFGVILSHLEEVVCYKPDLETVSENITEFAKVNRFGNGAYWGYLYENDFYLLKVYRGKWLNLRRLKSLPSKDVTGYTVPKFDVDFEIDGYCFLPKATDNYTFQTRYFEV